jgi:hypothetical protein
VNESLSENNTYEDSVIVTQWSRNREKLIMDNMMQDDIFAERNETYEQYRLHRDPYRAAKAVAENVLGFDVNPSDGDTVDVPPEFEDTEFQEHLTRWLHDYLEYEKDCNNNGSEGEPESLSAYRKQWPAPREEDGAMLEADIAKQIGIDYTEQVPIFFPRIDGDIYELPVPDGLKLATDSIKDDEKNSSTNGSLDMSSVKTNILIVTAARHSVEQSDTYDTLTAFVTACTRDLLKEAIDDEEPPFDLDQCGEKTEFVELSDRDMSLVNTICEGNNSQYPTPEVFVETAIRKELDLRPGETTTKTIDLSTELAAAIEGTEMDEFRDTIESALREKLDE